MFSMCFFFPFTFLFFFFFFMTLKVIVPSTQVFSILEDFHIQKMVERPDVNPNFKKPNKDFRLNFDIKF